MTRLLLVVGIALGLALSGAIAPAYAQQAGDKDKFMDRLETLTIWRMMEALDLDKATGNKVMEIRGRFLSERKRLRRSLNEDFGKLRELLKRPANAADDKELARIVQDVRGKRKRLSELHDEQYNDVSKILSVRQQAQLIVFLKDFRKEIHAILSQRSGPLLGRGMEGAFRRPPGVPRPGAAPPPGPPGRGGTGIPGMEPGHDNDGS